MPTPTEAEIIAGCLGLRGSLRLPPQPGQTAPRSVIVQGATEHNATHHDAAGKPILIYDKPQQTDPRRPAQLAQRAKMGRALAAWHAMTPEQREQFRQDAVRRRITIYQAAISFLLLHDAAGVTIWDNGATIWDGGTTRWDQTTATNWDNRETTWDGGSTQWDNLLAVTWDGGATVWDGGATQWT